MFCQVVWGVFSVLWGSVGVCGVLRSVRGRFSQVKGAFGVAKAMPLRGTLDLRASTAPGGRCCGQAKSPPVITRGAPADLHWFGWVRAP